jgi:hypothetical protein
MAIQGRSGERRQLKAARSVAAGRPPKTPPVRSTELKLFAAAGALPESVVSPHKKTARELKPSGLWDELPVRTGSIHPL